MAIPKTKLASKDCLLAPYLLGASCRDGYFPGQGNAGRQSLYHGQCPDRDAPYRLTFGGGGILQEANRESWQEWRFHLEVLNLLHLPTLAKRTKSSRLSFSISRIVK